MSDTSQSEPSMEEILASIRRIISEEGESKPVSAPARPASPASAMPAAPPAPALGPQPQRPAPPRAPEAARASDDDVLELTQPPRPPRAAPQDYAAHHPPADTPAPQQAVPNQRRPSPSTGDDALLCASASGAASAAFAQLSGGGIEDQAMAALPLGEGGRTLDDMVREMLRPMLKAWLDRNLSPLVERMVRAEIERLSRRS